MLRAFSDSFADLIERVVLCCCDIRPDSVLICLNCTPAIRAKLADSLSTECEVEEMMTSEPGLVCSKTAAKLAIEAVRKKMAASLLNIFARRCSNSMV